MMNHLRQKIWVVAMAMAFVFAYEMAGAQSADITRGGICTVGVDCPPEYEDGYSDYRPGRPERPERPSRPIRPAPGGRTEYREEVLNRYFHDENIDLVWLFRLFSRNLDGASVERVELRLQSRGYNNSLYLLADGRVVAEDPMPLSWSVLRPFPQIYLNYNMQRLDLAVRGKIFIQSIRIELRLPERRPNPPPQPPPDGREFFDLQQQVNQSFRGTNYIDLGQMLNIYAYQGYQIQSLTINGSSFGHEGGRASFIANSFTEGVVNLNNFSSAQTIFPRRALIIGRGADFLQLMLEGGVHVNSVSVRLVRF